MFQSAVGRFCFDPVMLIGMEKVHVRALASPRMA
jgi:hypothetical protein